MVEQLIGAIALLISAISKLAPSVVATITVMITAIAVFGSILAARDAGVFKKKGDADNTRDVPLSKEIPFEIEQLVSYYRQILNQSKISFWFSLVFASLGFFVIVTAAFLYTSTASGATIAQFLAGVIMDAVAGLFFVQSRSAQKSMAEFFDKLRKDRMYMESKMLCDSIVNDDAKDSLKMYLVLHYAGLEQPDTVVRAINSKPRERRQRQGQKDGSDRDLSPAATA
jgi:Cyanobacterial TRADD-N associated 2-Transmembrane domain